MVVFISCDKLHSSFIFVLDIRISCSYIALYSSFLYLRSCVLVTGFYTVGTTIKKELNLLILFVRSEERFAFFFFNEANVRSLA